MHEKIPFYELTTHIATAFSANLVYSDAQECVKARWTYPAYLVDSAMVKIHSIIDQIEIMQVSGSFVMFDKDKVILRNIASYASQQYAMVISMDTPFHALRKNIISRLQIILDKEIR